MKRPPSHDGPAIRTLRRCLPVVSVLVVSVTASAGVLEPSSCSTDPLPLLRVATESVAKTEVLARMTAPERCAAYRHHFLAAVHARERVSSCRGGTERDRSVARLDGAIEAMNSGIAENCAPE